MADVIRQETQYGFRYGAATVERLASHKGYVVVGVGTPRQHVVVTVTPSGLIRVEGPYKIVRQKYD